MLCKAAAPKEVRRVIAVSGCCLLAAWIPFFAGIPAAVLGLAPLALAIWLVMPSQWSPRTRVIGSLAVLIITIALVIGLVALAGLTNAYN